MVGWEGGGDFRWESSHWHQAKQFIGQDQNNSKNKNMLGQGSQRIRKLFSILCFFLLL